MMSSDNNNNNNNNNNNAPPALPPIHHSSPSSSSSTQQHPNSSATTNNANANANSNIIQQLCASCDRCRSLKTKCDGLRPCANCKTRYLRVNKLSLDSNNICNEIDISEFDCVYSPAKRRGPVPGKSSSSSQANKGGSSSSSSQQQQQSQSRVMSGGNGGGGGLLQQLNLTQLQLQQLQQQQLQQQQSTNNNINNLGGYNNINNSSSLQSNNQVVVDNNNLFMNNQGGGFDHLRINTPTAVGGVGGGGSLDGGGGFEWNQQQQQHHQQQSNYGRNVSSGMSINNNNSTGVDVNALLGQLTAQHQQHQHPGGGNNNSNSSIGNVVPTDQMKQMLLLQQQLMLQQQQIQSQQLAQQLVGGRGDGDGGGGAGQFSGGGGGGTNFGMNVGSGGGGAVDNSGAAFQLLQQYSNTQQQQQQQQTNMNQIQHLQHQHQVQTNIMNPMAVLSGQHQMQQQQQQRGSFLLDSTNNNYQQDDDVTQQRSAKRPANTTNSNSTKNTSSIVSTHLPLLDPKNPSGNLLRQYFELSANNILNLPPIPTNEEYCAILTQSSGMTYLPSNLPWYDQSALNAARFSQLALGALSNDQLGLALELSNASVLCLKNCIEEPSHKSCMSAIARAYLLHGIFRSLCGDMVRYFKYRRVCMTQIYMLDENDINVDALLAAISFHDAWAYMMYNAEEDSLPDIDGVLPRICTTNSGDGNNDASFGCRQVTEPMNQMWMQGEPRIFLKNEARIVDRSLDAMACAVRSCCDQANSEFKQMSRSSGGGGGGEVEECGVTPTALAVMASENELCSRNMVLSAHALLNQTNANQRVTKPGLIMLIMAMDAFLENSDLDGSSDGEQQQGGFSETQIRNLLASCEMAIKHPMLLHAPGPVYHMMSNAAVLLCHLLNGLHAKCSLSDSSSATAGSNNNEEAAAAGDNNDMESAMFYETLDTFMSIRKLLNMRRQHLPVRLRCHAIPRPNIGPSKKTEPEAPFIDLGETLMCSCRGCQGFVLMGCSPCVAAERSMRSANVQASEIYFEDDDEFKREIDDLGDFNFDDDALFSILSRVAHN